MKQKIAVFSMGGTIESFYDVTGPTPVLVPLEKKSIIPQALDKLGFAGCYRFEQLANLDSAKITPRHVQTLARKIVGCDSDYIIVTHGTNTMPQNGRMLEELLKKQGAEGKTVVFVTSMQPLRGDYKEWLSERQSEGWAHLRTTMQMIDTLGPGVHAIVNNRFVSPRRIDKFVASDDGVTVKDSGFVARHAAKPEGPPRAGGRS